MTDSSDQGSTGVDEDCNSLLLGFGNGYRLGCVGDEDRTIFAWGALLGTGPTEAGPPATSTAICKKHTLLPGMALTLHN